MRADSNLFDRKTCYLFEGHYLSVARCITAMKREMETQNSGRLHAICIAAEDCLFVSPRASGHLNFTPLEEFPSRKLLRLAP